MNEVLAFIKYLNSEIKERPQCMWVAMALKLKFNGQIYHNGPKGHAIIEINDICYDWDGVAKKTKQFLEFPQHYGDSHIVNHYFAMRGVLKRR